MTYVNGAVIAVPAAKKEVYREMAEAMGRFMKKQGALHVFDGWGADVPPGEVTSFPMAVQCKEDEVVVFSYIVWPSKEVGDKAMAAAGDDPEISKHFANPPFDGSRMIFGGFDALYDV